MNSRPEETSVPVFEIDQAENYGQYILHAAQDILFHLHGLTKHKTLLTAYVDEGNRFFLTSLLAVDEKKHLIFIDPPAQASLLEAALAARQITLTAQVDRIKMQLRLGTLERSQFNERPALCAILPERMLRLQRREFFRIDTPRHPPLRCKLAKRHPDGRAEAFEFILLDLSGGGLCLIGDEAHADRFLLGELFSDCRLEIPGESVLSVNLRVREVSRLETASGEHQLRLGCEFINLPGTRLTLIERYITRLERERKARANGLS